MREFMYFRKTEFGVCIKKKKIVNTVYNSEECLSGKQSHCMICSDHTEMSQQCIFIVLK